MRTQAVYLKSTMRQVAKYAVAEKDEWQLQTLHSRLPILKSLAVEGRQTAIRGLPVIEEEDAKAIVRAAMAMRGAAVSKKLPMQGAIQTWRKPRGNTEGWASPEAQTGSLLSEDASHLTE